MDHPNTQYLLPKPIFHYLANSVTEALFNLRRDKGKAPHKAVLLLALIQEVEEGRITDNKVFITPELLASFKEIWSRLVEGNWQCKFFLPFYDWFNATEHDYNGHEKLEI